MPKVDIKDFTSRWEYSKSTSRYKFDLTRNEDADPPYRRIGRFVGNWDGAIMAAIENAKTSTFRNRLNVPGATPYTIDLDEADLKAAGYPVDQQLFDKTANLGLKLQRMRDAFGMEFVNASVHVQYPGQMLPLHIDNISTLRNKAELHGIDLELEPERAARFIVMLTEWQMGHFWQYGNAVLKQWTPGDIIWHSWIDTPHATANAGFVPRITLQVTGIVTPHTQEILDSNQPFIMHV